MAVETKRIAIVGAGAAGLAASWLAGRDTSAHLTVYESREQLGGHANTVEVGSCSPRNALILDNVQISSGRQGCLPLQSSVWLHPRNGRYDG